MKIIPKISIKEYIEKAQVIAAESIDYVTVVMPNLEIAQSGWAVISKDEYLGQEGLNNMLNGHTVVASPIAIINRGQTRRFAFVNKFDNLEDVQNALKGNTGTFIYDIASKQQLL